MLQNIINRTDIIKSILRIIIIAALCISLVFISFMIAAVIISKTDFRYESLNMVTSLILAVDSFLCSFIISRLNKENGLIYGIFIALVLSLFIIILSLLHNTFAISPLLLTKLCPAFIAGAAGGIIGVNTN